MSRFRRAAAAFAAAVLATAAGAQASVPTPPPIYGIWLNPHGSVAVRTGACGGRLCGWIVWADADAQADARDGGVAHLIGTPILENYRQDAAANWLGTVYLPDKGKRFTSEIEQVDPNTMKVSGCILHGLICRSQLWHRIETPPRG